MQLRPFVLLVFMVSLAMVIAACTTDSDDDEVAAADDTVTEAVDDAGDDAAETDDAVAEESDDAVEEESDDTVEATDDEVVEDDDVVEDADDATVEDSDDATAEELDDATDDFALDEDEFDAVLLALGFEDESELEAPALDLESMSASTPGTTMEAYAYDNVYVGDITEQLLVAVSLDSSYAGDADSISAYVCDGDQVGFYVTGTLENGSASIQLAENAWLEFTINGDEINGSVTLEGDEVGSFDATEATGDAGFYVAEQTVEDVDVVGRWIVMEDGRQAGQVCVGVRVGPVCVGISVSRN